MDLVLALVGCQFFQGCYDSERISEQYSEKKITLVPALQGMVDCNLVQWLHFDIQQLLLLVLELPGPVAMREQVQVVAELAVVAAAH